ncbi:MAG TPA: protease inhibitor I42 family protein [Methanocorpusculum sp.]|nr:protease inhibitor I42 family protein [Methanocorpusculum sp.]HKL97699.1 protease inhibitor I42 family protein [Methanocorpusculum sp.]
MNKIILICIGACLLLTCLCAAGCITPDVPVSIADPVLTVTVEKDGMAIPTGASMQFVLPANPTTGYGWMVLKSEGLIIAEEYVATPVPEGWTGGGGYQYYTVTAEKAGTYPFTAEYKRAWETDAKPIYTFTQTLVFSKAENDERDGDVMLSLLFAGIINPKAGDVVKICTDGNPTTGYYWKAEPDGGLTVLKDDYITIPDTGLVGAGGTYEWYITAKKAGTYQFGAKCQRPGQDPTGLFYFDLTFV